MTNQSKHKLELEQILSAIGYDPKIGGTDDNKNQFTPYILPLELVGDRYLTVLKIDGRVVRQRIAFSYEAKDAASYYHFNGFLPQKVDSPADDRRYLPLAKTEYKIPLRINKDGKFTPRDGSPFHLLGILGMKEPFPLAYAHETTDGITCRGLYLNKDNVVTSFDFTTLDKVPLQHYLWRVKHQKRKESSKPAVDVDFSDPHAIIRYLNRFIVGQDAAKEMAAVSFSNYMVRKATDDEEIPLNHMLFIGPSGVGKTAMMRFLAKAAEIPCVSTKLVAKCAEGYRGQRLSPLFKEFRDHSDEEAPYGIVFLDELDKLAQAEQWYGERLMEELVGYIDDTTVKDWGGDNKEEKFEISTRNLLFVTAGAFLGYQQKKSLTQIVRERLMQDAKIHALPANDDLLAEVEPLDLIRYGIKNELAGRLNVVVPFHSLNEEERVKILSESELSPLHGYVKLLKVRGYELRTDGLAEVIAKSSAKETNARALQSACHKFFYKILLKPQQYADQDKVISLDSLDELTIRRLLASPVRK